MSMESISNTPEVEGEEKRRLDALEQVNIKPQNENELEIKPDIYGKSYVADVNGEEVNRYQSNEENLTKQKNEDLEALEQRRKSGEAFAVKDKRDFNLLDESGLTEDLENLDTKNNNYHVVVGPDGNKTYMDDTKYATSQKLTEEQDKLREDIYEAEKEGTGFRVKDRRDEDTEEIPYTESVSVDPEAVPESTPEPTPITLEPESIPTPTIPEPIPANPELTSEKISSSSIEELRDLYLKAKRLRGNVFRGKFGRLFGRKLDFGNEEVDFGGKKGSEDLEKIREEYQKKLSQYRSNELITLGGILDDRLAKGEIDEVEKNNEMRIRVIELLSEEQSNIDNRAVEGIEKNILEKMKTKWRQLGKTRLVAGALLGGASIATGGAGVIIGARAAMGGIGTYVGVEAGLERFSKLVGHRGLVGKINRDVGGAKKLTDENLYNHILKIPEEDIVKEASRLRMLQVEKGVAINRLSLIGDGSGRIVEMIIRRDNELNAKSVVYNATLENQKLNFADRLSIKLAGEIDARNETIESDVDKERIKKMIRKTTAIFAGGITGWLIGGKLLQKPETPTTGHTLTPVDISPSVENINHTVTSGENTWKIIESNLDSRDIMVGLKEGPRTHMIDALKDMFDKMSPVELKNLGFSSGDADLLRIGDSLNLSGVLNNPEILTKALFNSKNLSVEEITEIVKNNAKISQWLAEHHQDLKGIFDSSIIEKVLRGTI